MPAGECIVSRLSLKCRVKREGGVGSVLGVKEKVDANTNKDIAATALDVLTASSPFKE